MKSNFEIVELLLRFGANPRHENNQGENALLIACFNENYDICEKLLVARARIHEPDRQGRTPILRAV